jgi:integrase
VNVLRGVRRTHLRLGLQFPELTEIVKVANSLTATYVEKYYPGGLLPQRAEPMHNDEIKRLLEFVSPSAKATVRIGGRVERTGSRTVVSWRACVALLAQCGFRGSEVALGSGKAFGKVCINRASVTWRIGGVDVTDPTPEQLANLKVGDYVLIVPPPSKCDRFGIAWGSDPIYLAWHPTRPICAARELQQLELDFPVRGEEARRETPLFATNDGKMFVRTWLADSMKKALRACGVPSERVAVLTLHSYRRYLACCLLAANVSEAKICALLRWRSAKSLAAYATLNDKAYADMIDTAAEQAVSSIRTANIGRMPVTSHKEVALNMRRGAAGAEKAAAQTDDEAARAAVDDTGEA